MAARRPQRRPVVDRYERIVEAIRRGSYPPDSTLPPNRSSRPIWA